VFCVYCLLIACLIGLCTICTFSTLILLIGSLGLLTCKNRLTYNLYCVGRNVKQCSINQPITIQIQIDIILLCVLKLLAIVI